jgi:hypothetical protein
MQNYDFFNNKLIRVSQQQTQKTLINLDSNDPGKHNHGTKSHQPLLPSSTPFFF